MCVGFFKAAPNINNYPLQNVSRAKVGKLWWKAIPHSFHETFFPGIWCFGDYCRQQVSRHLYHSHHWGNPKSFRSSVLEMKRTKYFFLTINHNIIITQWDELCTISKPPLTYLRNNSIHVIGKIKYMQRAYWESWGHTGQASLQGFTPRLQAGWSAVSQPAASSFRGCLSYRGPLQLRSPPFQEYLTTEGEGWK